MKEYSEAQELSLGQRFLEKIIQIDFRIPKSSPSVVARFIEETLRT